MSLTKRLLARHGRGPILGTILDHPGQPRARCDAPPAAPMPPGRDPERRPEKATQLGFLFDREDS